MSGKARLTPIFKFSPDSVSAEARSDVDENSSNLKMFEREDWTLLRTIEGLQQKAGVSVLRLRRLVLKELADNALDAGTKVKLGWVDGEDRLFVQDSGPGLDGTPEQIAELFSIRRSMRSSKLLRLPQRGALGNGLRVVAGAVLASEGSLAVISRSRRLVPRPQTDGSTAVVEVTKSDHQAGTRIEITFGPVLPSDPEPFAWARAAVAMAGVGKGYEGNTSPYWYDAAQFHEVLLACGSQPVRSLIARLDGCSGGKAGEIVTAAGLDRIACKDIDRRQARRLLQIARGQARPVTPERLGYLGRDAFPTHQYGIERGIAAIGGSEPQANIPFVIEAWARKNTANQIEKSGDKVQIGMFVNRTPTVAEVSVWRDRDKDLWLQGGGLDAYCSDAPKKGAYDVKVNVTTPYCPITSDGKAPDLEPFADKIVAAIEKAMRKAQRAAPKDKKLSQKDVVLDNLDAAIAGASGHGEYRFNERQIYYQLRPIVLEETCQELLIGNFKNIITDYENEHGEIAGMYREPRGSIYHPHRGDVLQLGTLTVEEYERPQWTFNKLVYIEKEGFSEALKDDGWPERHDCALMSSKGFSTRAARDLVDKLAEHDEPVTIFCVHDADAFGTMIYQTFQEETKARGARKIKIVNLGLEAWEGIDMDLEIEEVPRGGQRKAVASYVLERGDGDHWGKWLQTHRIELNAMSTPEFIGWLDRKMAEDGTGKLIPPPEVLEAELAEQIEAKVRAAVTERILREAGLEAQIADTLNAIKRPAGAVLAAGIEAMFKRKSDYEWRDHIEACAAKAARLP